MMVVEREQQRRAAGGGAASAPAPAPRRTQQAHYATAPARAASASTARERLGLAPLPPAAPAPVPAASRAPMAHRGPRVVRRAKALGWWNPMSLAVLGASFAVSLSCLYVSAYARVVQEGNALAQVRRDIRAAQAEELDLRARIARMEHPDQVTARAKSLGMVPAPSAAQNILDAPTAPTAPAATVERP